MITSKLSVLSASAIVAIGAAAGTAQADLMVNGGFETLVTTTGTLPDGYGFWRGDMTSIVQAENDITPWEGVQMLRFVHTHRTGPTAAVGSELWQIIDVSSFESVIRSGRGSISASAFFNRVDHPLNNHIDTMFSIGVYAYAGDSSSFPSQWGRSELGSRQTSLFSDSDMESWEQAMVDMLLPTATDFVAIRISATENVFNDITGTEFQGHYADGVEFRIIPGPSSLLCLLPVALLGIGRRRRVA